MSIAPTLKCKFCGKEYTSPAWLSKHEVSCLKGIVNPPVKPVAPVVKPYEQIKYVRDLTKEPEPMKTISQLKIGPVESTITKKDRKHRVLRFLNKRQ